MLVLLPRSLNCFVLFSFFYSSISDGIVVFGVASMYHTRKKRYMHLIESVAIIYETRSHETETHRQTHNFGNRHIELMATKIYLRMKKKITPRFYIHNNKTLKTNQATLTQRRSYIIWCQCVINAFENYTTSLNPPNRGPPEWSLFRSDNNCLEWIERYTTVAFKHTLAFKQQQIIDNNNDGATASARRTISYVISVENMYRKTTA